MNTLHLSPIATIESAEGYRDVNLEGLSLSNQREISLEGTVTAEIVNAFRKMFFYLLQQNSQPISIIINSPGGEVQQGLAIYDLIEIAKADGVIVKTYAYGLAASMGALIFAAGTKGERYVYPNAKVMIHEPLISNSIGGSASNIQETAKSILEIKKQINSILSSETGKSLKEINAATRYDHFFTAEEAIEFGLADKVVTTLI